MKPVFLYLGPEDAVPALEPLRATFEVRRIPRDARQLAQELPGASAFLMADTDPRLTDNLVAGAPRLRVVGTATTGATHIDVSALERRGIRLFTLQGQTDVLRELTPAAELSWLLLMAVARRLRPATQHVLDGGWDRNRFPGIMLKGRTLGLIGLGRIGQWMSRYARAFGMRCQAFDPHLGKWPDAVEHCADLMALLETSDFVSLHVNYTDGASPLLCRDHFKRMRAGAIFINTSRGQLIDEAALLEALEAGHLSGAGLDVLSREPDIHDDPLLHYARTHDNLVLTPHIGGFSPDAVRIVVAHVSQQMAQAIGNG